jgi:hypothetical protein
VATFEAGHGRLRRVHPLRHLLLGQARPRPRFDQRARESNSGASPSYASRYSGSRSHFSCRSRIRVIAQSFLSALQSQFDLLGRFLGLLQEGLTTMTPPITDSDVALPTSESLRTMVEGGSFLDVLTTYIHYVYG